MSRSRFSRAEMTAAPLMTAMRATERRPLLPRRSFTRRRPNILSSALSLAPQNRDGIEASGATQRNEADDGSDESGESQDDGEKNEARLSGRAEDAGAEDSGEEQSEEEAGGSAGQREKEL